MRYGVAKSLIAAVVAMSLTVSAAVAQEELNEYDAYEEYVEPPRSIDADISIEMEMHQLRVQLEALAGLYNDLYQDVEASREYDPARDEFELVSLRQRLEAPTACFQNDYVEPVSSQYVEFNGQACCDSSCDSCCDPCCRPCGIYAGFAAVWIRPSFEENTAFVVDPPPNDNFVTPFDYSYDVTPRIWLGYNSVCGLGIRGRYWEYDQEADVASLLVTSSSPLAFVEVSRAGNNLTRSAFAGVGETITAKHSLEMQVFDLEATKQLHPGGMTMMLGLGLRYAKIDQNFRATVTTSSGVIDELVDHSHGFEGFGPTASLEILHPLCNPCCGLSAYGAIRGSVLFGDASQDILEIKGAGATVGRDRYRGDELLSIGEIEIGLQYALAFCYRTQAFVRVGYEGQIWWDAGGPLSTAGDMGLQGLSLGLGFSR